jgi:dephospho-CoA kinase
MATTKPLLLGVTGGIGSGKSLVCRIFQVLGTPVYNSDLRAKQLMVEDEALIGQIKAAFGEQSYSKGNLNRQYLAEKVFSDSEKLELLNSLVHPAVGRDFRIWVDRNASQSYLLKEAALIFETGSNKLLDQTILVSAPQQLRIARVLCRDSQRTEEQVRAIISNQWR